MARRARVLVGRPVPGDAVDLRARQAFSRRRHRRARFCAQVRRAVAEQTREVDEARRRQRRVLGDDEIEQRRGARLARLGARVDRDVVDGLVDAHAALAPGDAQQAAVVHRVEQVRRRAARAAPGVGAAAVRELLLDRARMARPARADELEQRRGAPARRRVPRLGGDARVHQREDAARHEAVVDEAVLVDRQARGSGARDHRRGSRRRDGAASGPARAPARGSDRPGRSRACRSRARASSA